MNLRNPVGSESDIEPLLSPDAFVGLENVTHLCTGGEGPWLKAHQDVYSQFARWKSGGRAARKQIDQRGERCREKVGRLWNVPSHRVAFMPSCAEAMSWLARGLDWQPGDNVVTTNLEFPSVAYAWRPLQARGVEVRLVPHRDWLVHEEDLLAAVDRRTRVLSVSQVSFYTGQCLDVERLREGLDRRGQALLALDATHASGVLEVPAALTDVTMTCCYKFMHATPGVAPCYVSERAEAQTATTSFGWRNLKIWPQQQAIRTPEVEEKSMPERVEPGNLATLPIMHLDQSLEVLLSVGARRIAEHARTLSERASAGLERLGYRVISPRDFGRRSGNTSFLIDDPEGMHDALAARGIHVWGEYGRMRVTTHLYNGSRDLDRFLEVLAELS
jgi:cysteine desulfurase/selenocysteine lyase